jgi:hypothetical protein
MIRVPVRIEHLRNRPAFRRDGIEHRIGNRRIDRRRFTGLPVVNQPDVIVGEGRDRDDLPASAL